MLICLTNTVPGILATLESENYKYHIQPKYLAIDVTKYWDQHTLSWGFCQGPGFLSGPLLPAYLPISIPLSTFPASCPAYFRSGKGYRGICEHGQWACEQRIYKQVGGKEVLFVGRCLKVGSGNFLGPCKPETGFISPSGSPQFCQSLARLITCNNFVTDLIIFRIFTYQILFLSILFSILEC